MSTIPGAAILLGSAAVAIVASLVVILAGAAVILWFVFGPGPRCSRATTNAARLLKMGKWQEAQQIIDGLRKGSVPADWEEQVDELEGKCLKAAGDDALDEGRYEEAHRLLQEAAPMLDTDPEVFRQHVVETMLDAARALIAAGPASSAAAAKQLDRTLALQPNSAEVPFWKALALACEGLLDRALPLLEQAHQLGNKQNIDPPLYAGILLYRQGKAQESLRILGDANRVDASCPFVAWQMGLSMLAAGGDVGVAVRVLQKAVGPSGLRMWMTAPARAWVEAFPSGKSFVRKLAEKHAFVCPVLGSDLKVLIRQADMALGQAYYRQGNFQESADVFDKLLQEAAPTLPVLRGLGLALTRLGKHDQAFKHLRAALEMEPTHALTAGYLALCGAKGRPQQPEDRPRNVAWAVKQVSRFDGTGNAEYAAIMSAVHAEARALNLAIPREDQLKLCTTLASVKAHDPEAAAGYLLLTTQHPDAARDEFAWLYGRACVAHQFKSAGDVELLTRIFRDPAAAKAYYAQQKWDLEEVEVLYLDRCAEHQPGQFPAALGPSYPQRGEELLLQKSAWLEEMNDLDGAFRSVAVLLRLAPRCLPAHDRAACLAYRRNDQAHAVRILDAWRAIDPNDPLPLVRRAVLDQKRGDQTACLGSIQQALGLARGEARATVACLGGRLMLATNVPEKAEAFFVECLRERPGHVEASWLLAALRAARGDDAGLASLAPAMRTDADDERYLLMSAVCHIVAGDPGKALEAAGKVKAGTALAPEGRFLASWAHLMRGEDGPAFQALQDVASSTGPSAELARGLLGRVALARAAYSDSIRWWSALDAPKRTEWKLDEPLRQTVLLAGLVAFKTGQFEQASERFREAAKLGLRDKRLGPLIALSLFKAGQRLLYDDKVPPKETKKGPQKETVDGDLTI